VLTQTGALLISIAIETTCLIGLAHTLGWMHRRERWAWMLAGCAATLVTHPFAWEFSVTHTPHLTPEGKALRIEGCVVVVEAVLYFVLLRISAARAAAASLLANAVSFSIGLLL